MSNLFEGIKKGQPIIVYWLDAITDTGWDEDKAIDEVKGCLMQTIGFFQLRWLGSTVRWECTSEGRTIGS